MSTIKLFESKKVRTHWDEKAETWYFSVIDVVEILTDSSNPRDYWFKMKKRVKTEDGLELSTICRQLKMKASDGKLRETDVADTQSLLRIIQSIPSPKAEPFKQWLAKVGYERMQEIQDPEMSLDRARENWQKLGRSEKWIQQRMTGQQMPWAFTNAIKKQLSIGKPEINLPITGKKVAWRKKMSLHS
jgi:DNA-damage-inducible protein D